MFVFAKMSWRILLVSIGLIVLVACGGNGNDSQDVGVATNHAKEGNGAGTSEEKATVGDADIVKREGVKTRPGIEDIIDSFRKLSFIIDTDMKHNDEQDSEQIRKAVTYEYIGEEVLDGETVDHVEIVVEIDDGAIVNESVYWINKEGEPVRMTSDGFEEEDPTMLNGACIDTLMEPFTQFEMDVARHVTNGDFKVTDYQTGELEVSGESYDSLQIEAENNDSNIANDYGHAEVFYYDDFQIIRSIEVSEHTVRDREVEMLEMKKK